jgi:hypothetical protein
MTLRSSPYALCMLFCGGFERGAIAILAHPDSVAPGAAGGEKYE